MIGKRAPGLSRLAGFVLVLLGLMAFAGTAAAETRTLKVFNVHTREKVVVAYKKNGRYLQSGLNQLNKLLRDYRRNEPTKMDPRLFDVVWEAYQRTRSNEYIHVISGYRSPATNEMLRRTRGGQAKKSQHMLGKAMDFYIPGVPLAKLRAIGFQIQGGGVGYYPRSGSPFVHLDVGNVRAWPRMSRSELARLFPDGKTLHLPADGKPLPGYQQALADYKRRSGKPIEIDRTSNVQVASASERTSSRSGKGLLASLFGGADEEEETSENFSAPVPAAKPSAAPQPVPPAAVAEPAAEPAAPEAPAEPKPEAVLAALPASAVPVPDASPLRANAPDAVGEEQPVEVAMVPVPTRRPAYEAPAAGGQDEIADALRTLDAESGTVVAAVAPQPRPAASGEAIMEALAAGNGSKDSMPVPGSRPASRDVVVAALPTPRPGDGSNGKGGRITASPRQAMLDAAAGQRSAVITSGVQTTPKAPRAQAGDSREEPRPVPVPIKPSDTRWALQAAKVPLPKRLPAATSAIRQAPEAVLVSGFSAQDRQVDLNRFSGKAVTFLSVVKFRQVD